MKMKTVAMFIQCFYHSNLNWTGYSEPMGSKHIYSIILKVEEHAAYHRRVLN